MSDTPETDYEINCKSFGFYTMGGLPTDAIGVEFARNLERERDAVEQEVADVRDVLLDALPHIGGSTKILAEMIVAERDEARSDLEFRRELYKLQTEQLNNANLRVERTKAYLEEIKSERDLWKLEAERWRDWKMS